MISYREALKKWNEGKEKWCLPRKGTEAYEEIQKIRNGESVKKEEESKKEPEPAKKEKTQKKPAPAKKEFEEEKGEYPGSDNKSIAAEVQQLKEIPEVKQTVDKFVKKNKPVASADLFAKAVLPGKLQKLF
jgi:hypothetical protein